MSGGPVLLSPNTESDGRGGGGVDEKSCCSSGSPLPVLITDRSPWLTLWRWTFLAGAQGPVGNTFCAWGGGLGGGAGAHAPLSHDAPPVSGYARLVPPTSDPFPRTGPSVSVAPPPRPVSPAHLLASATPTTHTCLPSGGGHAFGRGEVPSRLQGAQLMPSHCLPDAKCQLQWHL